MQSVDLKTLDMVFQVDGDRAPDLNAIKKRLRRDEEIKEVESKSISSNDIDERKEE